MVSVEEASPVEGRSQKSIKTEQVHKGSLREQWEGFENGANQTEKELFEWNESVDFLTHPTVDQEGLLDHSFEKVISAIEDELSQALEIAKKKGDVDIENSHVDIPHYIESSDGYGGLTVNDIFTRTKYDSRNRRGKTSIDFSEKPWDGQTKPEDITFKSRTILLNAFRDDETNTLIMKLDTSEILADTDGNETKAYKSTAYIKKDKRWEVIGTQEDASEAYIQEIENLDKHRTGEEAQNERFEELLQDQERVIAIEDNGRDALMALIDQEDGKSELNYSGLQYVARKDLGISSEDPENKYAGEYELYADKGAIEDAQEIAVMGQDRNDPTYWFLRGKDGDSQFMTRLFIKKENNK